MVIKLDLGVIFLLAIIFGGVWVVAKQLSDEYEYTAGLYTKGPYAEAQ